MKAAHLVETEAVDFLFYQIKFVKKVLGMALSLFHLACSQVFPYLALAVNKSPRVLFLSWVVWLCSIAFHMSVFLAKQLSKIRFVSNIIRTYLGLTLLSYFS